VSLNVFSIGGLLEVEIIKAYAQNKDRINEVRKHADANKRYFGFLPYSAYEELALKGQIWVAVSKDNQSLAGYLIFGGTYPYLKVFQLFVHSGFRKHGIGNLLVRELIKFGEAHSYLAVHGELVI
jgi:ribosomal protein S18 acetylase RimI-like enzyme